MVCYTYLNLIIVQKGETDEEEERRRRKNEMMNNFQNNFLRQQNYTFIQMRGSCSFFKHQNFMLKSLRCKSVLIQFTIQEIIFKVSLVKYFDF